MPQLCLLLWDNFNLFVNDGGLLIQKFIQGALLAHNITNRGLRNLIK